MFSKREALMKLASVVMAFAVVVPSACIAWFGEPRLPKKLQK